MWNGSVVLAKATTTSSYADVALFTDAPSHPAPSRDSSTVLVYTIPPAGAASALPPGIRRPRREDERSAFDAGAPSSASDDWRSRWLNRWHSWSSELWYEIRDLVRIRTVNSPEALLLSPGEAFFARENLKLRLLNARLALLSRNDTAFRSDLAEADRTLTRYFDTRARQTQAGREQIRLLQESVLNIEMPTLTHSLNAVRQ